MSDLETFNNPSSEKELKQQATISHVESEAGMGLKPLTSQERDKVLGITKSRNEVLVAKDYTESVVVLKKVKKDVGSGINPEDVARNEITALEDLRSKGVQMIPELASNKVTHDADGSPVVITKYKENYTALSSVKSLVTAELSDTNPKTNFLEKSFNSIADIHKADRTHGDLHLENVGITPPQNKSDIADIFVLDFERSRDLSADTDRQKNLWMTDDVVKFSAHTLFVASGYNSYSEIPQALAETIKSKAQTGYYEQMGKAIPANFDFELETAYDAIAKRLSVNQ